MQIAEYFVFVESCLLTVKRSAKDCACAHYIKFVKNN